MILPVHVLLLGHRVCIRVIWIKAEEMTKRHIINDVPDLMLQMQFDMCYSSN